MTTSSIWQDPWIAAATGSTPTTLPPPRPCLPTGVTFRCCAWTDLSHFERSEWRTLVQTRWTFEQLTVRLEHAYIARLLRDNVLIGTCVLRPREHQNWILETLIVSVKRQGWGSCIMRAAIRWIWDVSTSTPPSISFVWELSPLGLIKAAWAGWLSCAHRIDWGWIWTKTSQAAVNGANGTCLISDSGLGDGMGYVLAHTGNVDWNSVCEQGGWTTLWRALPHAPGSLPHSPGWLSYFSAKNGTWKWTGECIVTGVLNGPLRPVVSPYEVAAGSSMKM